MRKSKLVPGEDDNDLSLLFASEIGNTAQRIMEIDEEFRLNQIAHIRNKIESKAFWSTPKTD